MSIYQTLNYIHNIICRQKNSLFYPRTTSQTPEKGYHFINIRRGLYALARASESIIGNYKKLELKGYASVVERTIR